VTSTIWQNTSSVGDQFEVMRGVGTNNTVTQPSYKLLMCIVQMLIYSPISPMYKLVR
jgi:hypothetical protein